MRKQLLRRRQKQVWVSQGQILILVILSTLQVAHPCFTLEWIRPKLLILSHTRLSEPDSSTVAAALWFSPVVPSKLCLCIAFAELHLFSKILYVMDAPDPSYCRAKLMRNYYLLLMLLFKGYTNNMICISLNLHTFEYMCVFHMFSYIHLKMHLVIYLALAILTYCKDGRFKIIII